MATSSIFTNVVIKSEKDAERFVAAMEYASKQPNWTPSESIQKPVTDINAIRDFMSKRKQK